MFLNLVLFINRFSDIINICELKLNERFGFINCFCCWYSAVLREFQLHSWCIILLHLPEYRCTACHLISSIPRKQIICEIVLLQRDGLACPWLGIKSQHDLASKLQGGRLNQKEFLHTHIRALASKGVIMVPSASHVRNIKQVFRSWFLWFSVSHPQKQVAAATHLGNRR